MSESQRGTSPSPSDPYVNEGERIEALLDEIEASLAPDHWQRVQELVEGLSDMYGEGLRRTLAHLEEAGALDEGARERLCGDELLSSLLLLHGLHPEGTPARVARALDAVRPYLQSHRGDVELLGVEGGVVRLRLLGTCDGCSSSATTLANVVEGAVFEAAPEVERVALANEGPPTHDAPLVQIGRRSEIHDEHTETSCELCGASVGPEHAHVVDREQRSLLCACRACSLLFERGEGGRYRTVPDRVLVEPGRTLTAERLTVLGVPVTLAFLFFHSTLGRFVALYPSPAGPTESVLDEDVAKELLRESGLARALEPDVEALLVYGRRGEAALESYLAPIDACYELVGLIRKSWRGIGGGDEVHRDIEAFFGALRERAAPLTIEPRGTP